MAPKRSSIPSPARLKAVARSDLRVLQLALLKTKAGGSVHGARRQIKRLRSLLRLLRPSMVDDAFTRANVELRKAADALAGQRRAEALMIAAGRLDGTRRTVGRWLQLAEAYRDEHAGEATADGGVAAARKAIASASRAVDAARPKSDPAIVAAAFLATYRKARKRLDRGFRSGDAAELHEGRKYVIHHLHHMELLQQHLSATKTRRAALEQLRETLGDLNDLDELAQLAPDAGDLLSDAACGTMARRRNALLKRAQKQAGHLFNRKPRAFQKRIGAIWQGTGV